MQFYIEDDKGEVQDGSGTNQRLLDITRQIQNITEYGGNESGINVSNDGMFHTRKNNAFGFSVKNIEDYYIDASIYVSAARLEPWGLVLAEAKSFGLPIVCFDCPHGPKNIVRDGMDGNLIALNDCNEMKEKILLLMDDLELRRKYGEAARKDFECRFSKRAIFNKWTELLK